jgi:hypothetical protein
VAAIKGVTVSPLTPSWIDASSGKGARLDHLVGLGVEFTCASGAADWVGTPFHDHARVSFAVKLGTPKAKIKHVDKRAWHQKLTLKQWQGISHQIDDSLRRLANESLERLKGGEGDAEVANPEEAASAKVADRRRIPIVRACLTSVSICLLIDKPCTQYLDKNICRARTKLASE